MVESLGVGCDRVGMAIRHLKSSCGTDSEAANVNPKPDIVMYSSDRECLTQFTY